jgi:serine/threonine protein phosphatase PrpC
LNVSGAIKVVRLTDIGKVRDHNEDAVASDLTIGLLALADGMGGYRAGEVASEIAVLLIAAEITQAKLDSSYKELENSNFLPESYMLKKAVEKANAAIYQISQDQPQCAGMGTTLVAGIFTNNKLVVGHIGDSRAYRLRSGALEQLTEDHSLVQEQINAGLITQEQAQTSSQKNLVTRALGIEPEVELELQVFDVEVGDIYLLCSDGLSDMVNDEEIAETLREANGNITHAANRLVHLANEHGGVDNISVMVAIIKKEFSAEKSWVKNLLGKVKK